MDGIEPLWHQLSITDGIVCRTPSMDTVTVPLLPPSQCQGTLHLCHDVPSTGHLGMAKTLKRIQQEAYWVGMVRDVHSYCTNCMCVRERSFHLLMHHWSTPPLASHGKWWQLIFLRCQYLPKTILLASDYGPKSESYIYN